MRLADERPTDHARTTTHALYAAAYPPTTTVSPSVPAPRPWRRLHSWLILPSAPDDLEVLERRLASPSSAAEEIFRLAASRRVPDRALEVLAIHAIALGGLPVDFDVYDMIDARRQRRLRRAERRDDGGLAGLVEELRLALRATSDDATQNEELSR